MNAKNRSGVRTPRDGDVPPPPAGWVNPHPLGWAPPSGAGAADPETSASANSAGGHDPRLVAALESYMEALRLGQPCARDEFLARHPEIAEELGECLSGLEFIQTAVGQLGGAHGLKGVGPTEPIAPQTQLGDYRILRQVGRGGMGVVYEAQQISLGRRVALKVLPFAAAIDPKQRQRFQIEAQAAAQLHHAHIVPIFGVGCDHGIHYYAMQFVDGRSLAAIIHELRGEPAAPGGAGGLSAPGLAVSIDEASGTRTVAPATGSATGPNAAAGVSGPGLDVRSPDATAATADSSADDPSLAVSAAEPVHQDRDFCHKAARLGAEAADALDHAHGLGILHRDIKPANLLIDPSGAVWITDFGLARFPSDLSLTGTGDMVGTLRYMSPEQAQARRGVVDQRTDIYSLGVTLYELLTLRPAFDGRDHQELLNQIALDEPIAPRRLNPAIPRDLETIVLKAMAKDLSQRYATAQDLAADLGRFLADEPILAHRPGVVERTRRWARRHWQIVATAAAVAVVFLLISMSLIWFHAQETQVLAHNWQLAADKAQEARNAYYTYMVESYPLIDKFAVEAIGQAYTQAMGQAGPGNREEAFQIFDQWLKILQQLSELPRTDRESRIVIGRAGLRLGYVRAMLSRAKGTPDGRADSHLLDQARDDFRRSIALFDELVAASPGDAKLRNYLADAVGLFGQGCCFRFADKNGEAESCYRRAIELRRDVVRGVSPRGVNTGPAMDVASEVHNFSFLLYTVQMLAWMQEAAGQPAEAEKLFRQLKDDVKALAGRFAGPDYQGLRGRLAEPLLKESTSATPAERRTLLQNCEMALILDPENPYTDNNLAWALVSDPGDPWFDPKRAMKLARMAVSKSPPNGAFWNTLGVAAYRVGDWPTAAESLLKSIQINRGEGTDCLFLAMTRWHQGNKKEARQWFDQAVTWIKKNRSADPEVRRFHVEAAALLGVPGPDVQTGKGEDPRAQDRTGNIRQKDARCGGSGRSGEQDRSPEALG